MSSSYDFRELEPRWQRYWLENQVFRAANPGEPGGDRPSFYILDFFPYPSGAGLHVGHPLGYIATDILSRYRRMRGYNVLHPMGWDAFGLPAEQYAIETGVHPAVTTRRNIETYKRQLQMIGLGYDWSREVSTSEPDYYRWTQWIFLKLYDSFYDASCEWTDSAGRKVRGRAKPISELPVPSEVQGRGPRAIADYRDQRRLAYLAEVPVNWCPALGTVLANEEVTADGRSERGNHPVFRRPMKQWMLRITAYADRLLSDLEPLDWPDPIKLMQRNWIGRSEGAFVDFELLGLPGERLRVYTTRPDTLFGATYCVLAPEHPLVARLTTPERADAVRAYVETAARKTDLERTADAREKTGVFTGSHAVNPASGEKLPIWIADYVLAGYGTGAIMAVPAHDERDFEFAKQFDIPIRDVVAPSWLLALQTWCRQQGLMVDDGGNGPQAPRHNGPQPPSAASSAKADTEWREALAAALNPAQAAELAAFLNLPPLSGKGDTVALAHRAIDGLRVSSPDQLAALLQHGRLFAHVGAAYSGPGVGIHSSNAECSLNGLPTDEAKRTMTRWLEQRIRGVGAVQYKLRDWLFSRQRYWGEPFPILHAPDGLLEAVPESQLPVTLPEMDDFRPTASDDPNAAPQTPLSRATQWVKTIGIDGSPRTREVNTMPQWAGSCWYYLRFADPQNERRFVSPEAERYWLGGPDAAGQPKFGGVDLYVGGAEHAVLHLLYARFWHKVLYDLGEVSTPEPFAKLFNQGYIQAYAYRDERGVYVEATEVVDEHGTPAAEAQDKPGPFFHNGRPVQRDYGKMGKSLKNVVNPDSIIAEYGADTLRLYEMYMGPLDASKPWNTRDIIGVHRFLQRVWRLVMGDEDADDRANPVVRPGRLNPKIGDEGDGELERLLHKTIKKVGGDIERFALNTAIAQLIVFVNEAGRVDRISRSQVERFLTLLAPFAPHLSEELWSRLGRTPTIAHAAWPAYDEAMTVDATVEIAVQVNGKVRGRIQAPADSSDDALIALAQSLEAVQRELAGKAVKRSVVVKGRLVNLIIG